MQSVAKKRLLLKKFKRHYLCSNQKLASTQTAGSAFLERVRKVQNYECCKFFCFLTRCEKCFTFFLQLRKLFQIFDQMWKMFQFFLTRCKNCFHFFDKMWKCFNFFDKMQKKSNFFYKVQKVCEFSCQDAKTIRQFFFAYKVSSDFLNMFAKINRDF